MIYGTWKDKINYNEFESPLAGDIFVERCEKFRHISFKSCGTGALSMLTGMHPHSVQKLVPKTADDGHWTDQSITRFLKKRGYMVKQLSRRAVTNLDPISEWERMPLKSWHVLLCGLLMCRNEGSWLVIHGNKNFHNLKVEELHPLLFVNKPSDSIYLVTHKSWKYA